MLYKFISDYNWRLNNRYEKLYTLLINTYQQRFLSLIYDIKLNLIDIKISQHGIKHKFRFLLNFI